MAYSYHRGPSATRSGMMTIVLIGINIVVFLVGWVGRGDILYSLALVPGAVAQGSQGWWTLVTYMFVHANFTHLLFNMLSLFLFGIRIESRVGPGDFLAFYLACGVGAGLVTLLVNNAAGMGGVPVVGASGAIYGVLLAFAAFYPFDRIFVFGLLPLRAPVAVGAFAGIELVLQLTNLQSGVAHIAHLSGIAVAFLYLLVRWRINAISVFFRRR